MYHACIFIDLSVSPLAITTENESVVVVVFLAESLATPEANYKSLRSSNAAQIQFVSSHLTNIFVVALLQYCIDSFAVN